MGGCHHDNRPSSSKIMKLVLLIGIFQNTRTYEEKQRFPRFTTKESLNSVNHKIKTTTNKNIK